MLSYNVLLPSDEPNIARLMGMWSVWMFAVPSLRARECDAKEKDALNFLFIAIPLVNVLIPVVWKSFAAVFTADCLLMAYMYYNKGAGIFDDGSEKAARAHRVSATYNTDSISLRLRRACLLSPNSPLLKVTAGRYIASALRLASSCSADSPPPWS